MLLKTIIKELGLEVKTDSGNITNEVTGAYVSDLLSDVIANSEAGNI